MLSGLVLAGCTSESHGNEVRLLVEATGTDKLAPDISLDYAFVALESVELIACSTSASASRQAPIWTWLAANLTSFPRAHAHGAGSPTEIAVPVVLGADDEDPLELSVFLPPAGRYCALGVTLGPADADAVNLPTRVDMRGRSFDARGEDELGAFAFDSADEIYVELSFATPLELRDHRRFSATLSFDIEALLTRALASNAQRKGDNTWRSALVSAFSVRTEG
jgi:hypothetical protein